MQSVANRRRVLAFQRDDLDVSCPTDDPCRSCRQSGTVAVAPIRWNYLRQLNWHCRACGFAWTTEDRREAS